MRQTHVAWTSRFVPIWKRLGVQSDDIFSSVMQSSNPVQMMARNRRREEEAQESCAVEAMAQSTEMQRDYRIAKEREQERQELEERRRVFLPLGVQPSSSSPCWGARPVRALRNSPVPLFDDGVHASWKSRKAAFVFDVDGVLRESGMRKIPGATESLQYLTDHGIPYLLLSNAGGLTEEEAAKRFTKLFGVQITAQHVQLSHSPMRHITPHLVQQGAALIIGPPETSTRIAQSLGFRSIVTTAEVRRHFPEWVPCAYSDGRGSAPGVPFPPISAVVVLSVLHCDALSDIQLALDVLVSPLGIVNGTMGTSQSVPLLIAADDFFFPATPALCPRLGPGAFREMLSAVYEATTGQRLRVIHYGKPRKIAFAQAQRTLEALAGCDGLDLIIMLGDNVDTDIVGANAMGRPWQSVLVGSGIGESTRAAVRTHDLADAEAEWLQRFVSPAPHRTFSSAAECVATLTALDVRACLDEVPICFPPLCPTNLHEMYSYPSSLQGHSHMTP